MKTDSRVVDAGPDRFIIARDADLPDRHGAPAPFRAFIYHNFASGGTGKGWHSDTRSGFRTFEGALHWCRAQQQPVYAADLLKD